MYSRKDKTHKIEMVASSATANCTRFYGLIITGVYIMHTTMVVMGDSSWGKIRNEAVWVKMEKEA